MSSATNHSTNFLTRRKFVAVLAALPFIGLLSKPLQPITRQASLDISVQAIVLHDATTKGDSGAIQVELSKLRAMVEGVMI